MIVRAPGMGAVERATTIQALRRIALAKLLTAAGRRPGFMRLGLGQDSVIPIDFPAATTDGGGGALPITIPDLPVDTSLFQLPSLTPDQVNLALQQSQAILPAAGTPVPAAGSSTWSQTLQQLLLGGEKIAGLATMPAGSYTTTRINPRTGQTETVVANTGIPGFGPGAISSVGGFSTGTLLIIGGVGLGLVVLVSVLGGRGK